MKLAATLKVSGDNKDLKKLFDTEKSKSKNDRASYTTKMVGKDFCITIEASDSTAFRAMLNTISKLLTIYEKTEEVMKG